MAAVDRSLSDVLHDIIGNVQDIMRSEVRLAKGELRDQVVSAKAWSVLIGAGAVTAMFAILFLLLTAVFSLALIIPLWTSTLIVGAVLGAVASAMLVRGAGRFKHLYKVGETIEGQGKEQWTEQQIR
jgi:hypothetical protein